MTQGRNQRTRLFMATMLSALVHGLIVLLVLVAWAAFSSHEEEGPQGQFTAGNSRLFWDYGKPPLGRSANPNNNLDVVPFSAQLIPIAMVGQAAKVTDPVRILVSASQGGKGFGNQNARIAETSSRAPGFLASCLGMESREERLAILIDRSLSMGLSGAWDNVVREMSQVLPGVSPDHLYRIWLFDKGCEEIAGSGEWEYWNPNRVSLVIRQLHETRPGGLTNLNHAMRAVTLRGANRIVLLSDDADLNQGDWVSICTTLRRLGKPIPRICALRMGSQGAGGTLASICQQTGGWYRNYQNP